jgi:hypothetical protein
MDEDRPFDAGESYLCDASEQSMTKWHSASLVFAVRGIVERSPHFFHETASSRLAAFRAAADELTSRGLDADSLVRHGMWDKIASSLTGILVASPGLSRRYRA